MWPEPDDEDYAISEDARDLISSLLAFEPSDRLGHKGAKQVQSHPWFDGIEWDTLKEQPAVMVPKTSNIFDTSYFDGN